MIHEEFVAQQRAKASLKPISVKENLTAIVIGVTEYDPKKAAPLPSAANDAEGIAAFLKETWGVKEERIYCLTGIVKGVGLMAQIKKVCDSLGEEDQLLFYYAGHGIEINGHSYLVLSDMDFDKGLEDPEYNGICLAELNQVMKECKAKIKVRIFDACYCGESFDGVAARGGLDMKPEAHVRGLDEGVAISAIKAVLTTNMIKEIMESGNGWITFCSCGMDETSGVMRKSDDPEEHGVFTYWLLKGLKGAARRGEGPMYLEDLKIYLSDTVPYTIKYYNAENGSQNPQFQCAVQGNIILD